MAKLTEKNVIDSLLNEVLEGIHHLIMSVSLHWIKNGLTRQYSTIREVIIQC